MVREKERERERERVCPAEENSPLSSFTIDYATKCK